MKLKDNIKKLFSYSNYEYSEMHNAEFIIEDAAAIFYIMLGCSALMSVLIILCIIMPDLRYDNNMDNMPSLVLQAVGGLLGAMLCKCRMRDEKSTYAVRRIARIYAGLLFSGMSCYNFLSSKSTSDAIFMFLIFCIFTLNVLHVNPITFSLPLVIIAIAVAPQLFSYFKSVGAIISLYSLLAIMMLLSFINNYKVRKKLENIDKLDDYKKELEEELQKKTDQIIDSVRKQAVIQENTILAIADLVESRDTDTGTHIKSTSCYVRLIAEAAAKTEEYSKIMTDKYIKILEKAAPMHDIGKIMTPDSILKVPRRLTDEEFKIMRLHASEGARIIKHVYTGIETAEYIRCAANIAHYHHERWDGKGYPEGLKGDQIPLEARIMAVADVFDALVSKRCYKDAFPLSQAFEEIENNSGTQFDPKIVKIFMENKDKITEIIVNNDFEDNNKKA